MLLTAADSFLNASSSLTEKFGNSSDEHHGSTGKMIVILIVMVIWIGLVLCIGKYLWNHCMCKVVNICKPIDSVFTILGLVVLLDILRPQLSHYRN